MLSRFPDSNPGAKALLCLESLENSREIRDLPPDFSKQLQDLRESD